MTDDRDNLMHLRCTIWVLIQLFIFLQNPIPPMNLVFVHGPIQVPVEFKSWAMRNRFLWHGLSSVQFRKIDHCQVLKAGHMHQYGNGSFLSHHNPLQRIKWHSSLHVLILGVGGGKP